MRVYYQNVPEAVAQETKTRHFGDIEKSLKNLHFLMDGQCKLERIYRVKGALRAIIADSFNLRVSDTKYIVVDDRGGTGLKCKDCTDFVSKLVIGTEVTVDIVMGDRVHIKEPIEGWLSLQNGAGDTMLLPRDAASDGEQALVQKAIAEKQDFWTVANRFWETMGPDAAEIVSIQKIDDRRSKKAVFEVLLSSKIEELQRPKDPAEAADPAVADHLDVKSNDDDGGGGDGGDGGNGDDAAQSESKWQWLENDGTWHDYDASVQQQLDGLAIGESMIIKAAKWSYDVTKTAQDECTQRNVKTKKTRRCRRFHVLAVSDSTKSEQSADKMERTLFHGTSPQNVVKILRSGFNRDFNSRSAYGKGTYFSSMASESAKYCRQHKGADNGDYVMLFCRVIVGEYAVGTPHSRTQYKNDGKTQYDSFVNRLDRPTIFVINRDYHAIPTHIVRFRYRV